MVVVVVVGVAVVVVLVVVGPAVVVVVVAASTQNSLLITRFRKDPTTYPLKIVGKGTLPTCTSLTPSPILSSIFEATVPPSKMFPLIEKYKFSSFRSV